MPEGPFLFPAQERSDQALEVTLAELIREQILRRTFQEVPHAVEVKIDEIERRGDMTIVRALAWVETESQKGILIGAGGRMIKAVGTAARRELERELGGRASRSVGARAPRLAGRRVAARPARDRVAGCRCARGSSAGCGPTSPDGAERARTRLSRYPEEL